MEDPMRQHILDLTHNGADILRVLRELADSASDPLDRQEAQRLLTLWEPRIHGEG